MIFNLRLIVNQEDNFIELKVKMEVEEDEIVSIQGQGQGELGTYDIENDIKEESLKFGDNDETNLRMGDLKYTLSFDISQDLIQCRTMELSRNQ